MPIRCRALLAPPAATVAAAAATPAEDGAAPATPAQPASQETDATFGRKMRAKSRTSGHGSCEYIFAIFV